MADADVPITAGVGTKIDTRTVGAGTDEHRQVICIGDDSNTTVARVIVGADGVGRLETMVEGSTADANTYTGAPVVVAVLDGSNTVRTLHTPETNGMSAVQILAAGLMGYNGATFDRLLATSGRLEVNLPGSLVGKAEDVASGPGDVGLPVLGVRNDTPTALTNTDGDYSMVGVDKYGRMLIAPVRSLPKSIQVSGSIGITTAAVWNDKAVWVVPSNFLFAPKMARSAVTTAGTRTLVLAGKQLATFNPGTNAFTATGSVSSPDFYDRLFYRVATTHSATADTITAAYVDQDGNGSNTGGLVIAASAAGGSWFEFILATGDFGARSVSAVVDTAAPTSVVDEIWGFRTLLEDLGPANTPHIAYLGEGLQIPAGESVVILFNAAATTAQQRFASVLGDLVAA